MPVMGDEILGDDLSLGADEILGASLLLGDGSELLGDDLLGAARPQSRAALQRAQRARMARLQQLAALRAAGGVAVQPRTGTESRVLPIGFDSVTNVTAGTTVPITKQPQVLFRPRRLVVAGGIASTFLIEDIKIGKDSQFVASGAIPASAFAPDVVVLDLKMDTCQLAASIVMTVTNITLADARFNAVMFGDSVQ
jgi:hypothetical protein